MRGAIIKRGKKFVVVEYLGLDPATGKERRKWHSGFESKKDARSFQASLASHPAFTAGIGPYGNTRQRLGEFVERWLQDFARHNVRSTTYERYGQLVRCHVTPALGTMPIVRLTPQAIERFWNGLPKTTTAHHVAALLRQILTYAVRRGIILQNPSEMVALPKRTPPSLKVWTPDEAMKFLDAARSSPHYLFYALAIAAGLRAGELLRLQWGDLDLARGILNVSSGKTMNARRAVLLPSQLVAELRQRRGVGLVFRTPKGTPLNLNTLRYRDFLPTIEDAGVPRIRIHDLRHFHASYLLANGADLASLSGRLGHSSRAFTLATYAHMLPEGQEHAARIANGLLTDSVGFRASNGQPNSV